MEHDNSGFRPGWFLEKVEIVNQATSATSVFPCQRWLDKDKDDGKIVRDILVSCWWKKTMLYALYCTFGKLVTFFQILSRDWWDIVAKFFFYKQYVDIGRIWNLKSLFLILSFKFIFDQQYFDISRTWNLKSRYEIVINQTNLFFPVWLCYVKLFLKWCLVNFILNFSHHCLKSRLKIYGGGKKRVKSYDYFTSFDWSLMANDNNIIILYTCHISYGFILVNFQLLMPVLRQCVLQFPQQIKVTART